MSRYACSRTICVSGIPAAISRVVNRHCSRAGSGQCWSPGVEPVILADATCMCNYTVFVKGHVVSPAWVTARVPTPHPPLSPFQGIPVHSEPVTAQWHNVRSVQNDRKRRTFSFAIWNGRYLTSVKPNCTIWKCFLPF